MAIDLNGTTGITTTGLTSNGIDDNATSTAMTLDTSGNVGIGTSSPTTALTVSTDGTEQLTINRADASINTGNTVGTILFTGDDPSASQTGARMQVIASQNWSSNAYGSHITFSNDSSGTLTERMRLDSSGNLLVGTTTANTTGTTIHSDGEFYGIRNSNPVATFDRSTSDGEIVRFRKDGSTVGSIGIEGGDLTIGKTGAGLQFRSDDPAIRAFNMTTNSPSDATVNLGRVNTRFKDLYLSGGVYLGGTGSANKLDDYEEGTWTPNIAYTGNGVQANTNLAAGAYTKVGRLVNLTGMISLTDTNSGTGSVLLRGFPFTVAEVVNNTSVEASGVISYFSNLGENVNTMTIAAISGQTYAEMYKGTSGSAAPPANSTTMNAGSQIRFSITYFAS